MNLALEIKNLKETYKDGTEALKGISFNVEEGDFFALLGPNGAGKSTTISILTSLISKTAGDVKVFGFDLVSESSQVKQCIGVVPQEFNFNQFEPVENIILTQAGYYGISRKTARINTEKYLRMLGLWEKRKQAARKLSGGMKRRLMIARALVHEPKLLILDEPTAGVDIELRRSLWDFLLELNRAQCTIILTTHYLEEAESLCRNVAIINQGKIIRNTQMRTLLRELESEKFILDLEQAVDEAPVLAGFTVKHVDALTLEVKVPKDKTMNELFKQCSEQQIEIASLRNKTNRLEELFINLTK